MMVIDIDSFLNDFSSKKNDKLNSDDLDIENKNSPLDFQSDVEFKLSKVKKQALNRDYSILKKIYTEVKDFDSDLTDKFIGIEVKSDDALKELGEKYSSEFLEIVKKNKAGLVSILEDNFNKLTVELENSNFNEILKIYKNITNSLKSFPNEFMIEKIDYSVKAREFETKILKKIQNYKNNDLVKKKIDLKKKVVYLDSLLVPGKINEIEDSLNEIQYMIRSIPNVFISDFLKENIFVSRLIIKAKKFLKEEYLREFNEKKKIIKFLFEKFHRNYISSNVDAVLLTYDEILFEFNSLPDLFIEEKVSLYNNINDLFSKINKLLLKNQVSLFLETYNSSKIIEEAREYLRHCNASKSVDIENLKLLRKKLVTINNKYAYEKDILLNVIDKFLDRYQLKSNFSNSVNSLSIERKNEIINKNNLNSVDNNTVNNVGIGYYSNYNNSGNNSNDSNNNSDNSDNINNNSNVGENDNLFDLTNEIRVNRNSLNSKSSSSVIDFNSNSINDRIKRNINNDLNVLISSNDPDELKLAYKDIILNLDMSPLSKDDRDVIKMKIKDILMTKDFS